jgi:poly-gamma-glutamate synthesis protein (capsule biosynthesis protein)
LNEENSYYSLTINNLETVFINYNQFIAGGLEQTIANLNKFKDKNVFIVLYAHWGDEYLANPSFRTVELAHQFIDEGADLVIGSHPHVIQKREIYNGKQIYYSLGNFVFDQYFSKETTEGLLVELSIDPFSKNYSTKEYKVTLLTNGQTILLE